MKDKPNGYRIIVGKEKGSGLFEYFKGSKKQAIKLRNRMKDIAIHSFNCDKVYVVLQPCFLRTCKMCNKNLTEEYTCFKCEDLLSDAQIEMRYEREAIENEY